MCFTPIISLSIAIFEFVVAFALLLFFRRSKLSMYFAIFIFLLGAYQLTEYLLCVTIMPILWAKLGFIIYTFLPALALIFALDLLFKKHNKILILIPPIVFSIIALASNTFIITSQCTNLFVLVESTFFNFSSIFLPIIYWIYYFGFIGLVGYLLIRNYIKTNDKVRKTILLLILTAMFLSILSAIVFLMFFPMFAIKFPSVYCFFAVIFTFMGIIVCYLEKKHRFILNK